jgi:hypothetical protein
LDQQLLEDGKMTTLESLHVRMLHTTRLAEVEAVLLQMKWEWLLLEVGHDPHTGARIATFGAKNLWCLRCYEALNATQVRIDELQRQVICCCRHCGRSATPFGTLLAAAA